MKGKREYMKVVCLFVASFFLLNFLGSVEQARATITVTNLNDDGPGSLRRAIDDASPDETINFSVTGTITLTTGELMIYRNLTIVGPGEDLLHISGNNSSRVFFIGLDRKKGKAIEVIQPFEVTISGITIKNGSQSVGGGIYIYEGHLELTDCTICSCSATPTINPNLGGGIYNNSTLTMTQCTFYDNDAADSGGGVCNDWDLFADACSFFRNSCAEEGGAIANSHDGIAVLTECEIFENFGESGAGLYNAYIVDLIDCTLRDNEAEDGGGIYNETMFYEGKSKRSTVDESAQGPGVWMRGCTVSGNTAEYGGGGIYNEEEAWLSLIDCTVSFNRASVFGGGIDNRGTAVLDSCTLSADTCGAAGGGMANWYKATLDRCTISENSGTGTVGGAGLFNASDYMWTHEGATFSPDKREKRRKTNLKENEIPPDGDPEMVLTNCTISGNETWVNGGGIYNDYSKLRLINCTVTDNSAGIDGVKMGALEQEWGKGGGIYNRIVDQSQKATGLNGPSVQLKNTIVADNDAYEDGPDCWGYLELCGYNLFGDSDGLFFNEVVNIGTNLFDVDPMLGPLADNGGATMTHALLHGSPALDGGTCVCVDGEQITADQRGEPRPQDGDYDFIPLCDMGAYEAPGLPPKMHYPQLPDRAGWDVFCTFALPWLDHHVPLILLADDWSCTESGPVTDIVFWGSWLNDRIGKMYGFIPLIFSDIPAGEWPPYSMPGELLWPPEEFLCELGQLFLEIGPAAFATVMNEFFSWDSTLIMMDEPLQGFLVPGEIHRTNDHVTFFKYHLHVRAPFPFFQEEGETYWLSIVPFYNFEQYGWGWKSSRDQWNDGAVYVWLEGEKAKGFDTSSDQGKGAHALLNLSAQPLEWSELRDPIEPHDSLDLAFVISTGCIEEVWVDQNWAGTPPGDEVEPGKIFGFNAFSTVGEAIDAVCIGGTVTVADGTYPEPGLAIMKDGLTIRAGSRPIFDGGGSFGWWIRANNITVLGWEFTNCDPALRLGPDLLGIPITGFVVHDCHFNNDNANRWALWVDGHVGTVDAEDNYWDSCTGPQHNNNPQGQGEFITPPGADVDYDPWLNPCAYSDGDSCLTHILPGDPDEYLEGSNDPTGDWWAVAFYNPGGVAKITSLAFRFFDPGAINVSVFTPGDSLPEDGMCVSGLLEGVPALLGDSLAPATSHFFLGLGLTNWEQMTLDSCVTVGSKSWFIVAWQKASEYPRIIADDVGSGTYSWIWNAEMRGWKCFPGLEYCLEVCLDYQPGCVTLDRQDIQWSPPYPCVCDDYNVTALFYNECNTPEEVEVEFWEAPWGLFSLPGPNDWRCGPDLYTVPANGSLPVWCTCAYHHETDATDSWSRNIVIRYSRDVNFCWDEPGPVYRYVRRCRQTIWPETYYDDMPSGTYGPIEIPIMNDEGTRMRFDVSVIDTSSWDFQLFYHGVPADSFSLDPQEEDVLYLTAMSLRDVGPLVVWVEALKCNGEVGVVEIEFLPFSYPFDIQPIGLDSLRVSRNYPCADSTDFFITFDATNFGGESAYPMVSFGMAQWGFFFLQDPYDVIPLTLGGYQTERVLIDDPMFVWSQEGHHYSRNVVLDYEIVREHCFEVEVPEVVFYRDCRRVIWPGHRWPWDGEVIPIPVFNEEFYEDTVDVAVVDSTVPDGWIYFLSRTMVPLAPGTADTAFLSVVPQGSVPPMPPDNKIAVRAVKGFCDRDTEYVYIEFLPYACLCIPDYLGKVVENLPGKDPELVPGDTVLVNLMLENDDSVTAIQVDLDFAEDLLKFDSVTLTPRTMGMGLGYDSLAPGLWRLRLDFTAGPPHVKIPPSQPGYPCELKSSEDILKVATVAFIIEDDPVPGTCSNIYSRNLIVAGLPDADGEPKDQVCACTNHGQICFGGYVFPMKCDVNGDTTLTLVDIFKILRHIIRFELLAGPVDSAGSAMWAADANGDHAINILDLMKCINKSVGRVDPKLAAVEVGVEVPEALELRPGRRMEVPVGIETEEPLAGVLYRLRYDESVIEVGQPEVTDRCRAMDVNWGRVDDELWILVSSLGGGVMGAGQGPVLRVPLQVPEGASGEWEVWFEETVVFTADERIVFADPVRMSLRPVSLVPTEYSLSQNYPNPFNPETEIQYGLPKDCQVRLDVYNLLGQRVITLVDEHQEAGYWSLSWDARDTDGREVSSGIYFYTLKAETFVATKRMVLVK